MRPSRALQRHHSLGLPMGSDFERTATRSPFLMERSMPDVGGWPCNSLSGV